MSYILDALKKSDEQRQALSLNQDASKPVQQTSSSVKTVIILTFVGLLAAWAGWLLAQSGKEPDSVTTTVVTPLPELHLQQPEAEEVAVAPPVTPEIIQLEAERADFVPITPESTDSGATSATPERGELSQELLQAMPALKIEGHIYDENPAARMVIINGSVRREKQNIDNDLVVQEITSDGVLLRYHGETFHMGTFD